MSSKIAMLSGIPKLEEKVNKKCTVNKWTMEISILKCKWAIRIWKNVQHLQLSKLYRDPISFCQNRYQRKLSTTNADQDERKKEPFHIIGENKN